MLGTNPNGKCTGSKLLFNALVDKLFSYGWVTEKHAEDAKIQYDEFLALPCKQNQNSSSSAF